MPIGSRTRSIARRRMSRGSRSEAGNLRQERDRLAQEAAASVQRQAAEREATIAGFERLATTFRRIDAAASLTEILGALAPAAAAETARVALLVAAPGVGGLAGNFKPWGIYGFPTPPEGFELPVASAEDSGSHRPPLCAAARLARGARAPDSSGRPDRRDAVRGRRRGGASDAGAVARSDRAARTARRDAYGSAHRAAHGAGRRDQDWRRDGRRRAERAPLRETADLRNQDVQRSARSSRRSAPRSV